MGSKLKNFLLDLISFNSPQAIAVNLFLIFLILAILPTEWLTYSPVKCIFKHVILPIVFHGNCPSFGLFANCECPACGMTRGMSRLLHGDINGALNYNGLVIILFIVMIIVFAINLVKSIKEYRKTRIIYPFNKL